MDIEYFDNDSHDKMDENKTHLILMAIVLIGAFNWSTTAFGYNIVKMLSDFINKQFNSSIPIDNIIYLIVGVCGLMLATRRNSWLPFLGKTVLPNSLIQLKTPANVNKKVQIKVKPNTKVIYWAASGKDNKQDYKMAYGDYSNSGVVMSDSNGNAELLFAEGSGYKVPTGKTLSKHVHYRVVHSDAMIGQINTVMY